MPASCSTHWSRPSTTDGPSIAAASYTIATGAARADSIGRRNTVLPSRSEQVVKRLCGCIPIKRLAAPGVEGGRYGGNLLGAVRAEIGAFGEVLAQQPVGVLVGAALPWAVRIAEVDLHTRVDLDACVLSHLCSLVPSQRPTQLLRQGDDRARDGVAHRVGTMSGEGGSVLHASVTAMARHARQVQQQSESSRALHQCADRRTAKTQDEVSFPMARHGAIGCFRWTLADHDLGRDEGLASSARARPRYPERPPGAQARRQLAPQRASSLNEQRLIDGFMANAHGLIVREVDRESAGYLLWAPGVCPPPILPPSMSTAFPGHGRAGHKSPARSDDDASQSLLHIGSQRRIDRKLPLLWPASGSLGMPLRCRRAILQ